MLILAEVNINFDLGKCFDYHQHFRICALHSESFHAGKRCESCDNLIAETVTAAADGKLMKT